MKVVDENGVEVFTNIHSNLNNNGGFIMKTVQPKTTFTFLRDGTFTLEIRDVTTQAADDRYAYRVLFRPQVPHVGGVHIAEDHLNLNPGEVKKLSIVTDQEEGFDGYIGLVAEGLPQGVRTMMATEVHPRQAAAAERRKETPLRGEESDRDAAGRRGRRCTGHNDAKQGEDQGDTRACGQDGEARRGERAPGDGATAGHDREPGKFGAGTGGAMSSHINSMVVSSTVGLDINRLLRAAVSCAVLLLSSGLGASAASRTELVSVELLPKEITLRGADASQQLLVLGRFADGSEKDLTSEAKIQVSDPAVARLDPSARVLALSDGTTRISATARGLQATAAFRVTRSDEKRPFSFARDVGGVLTRRGCNGAACHGGVKGKNGFRLSDNAEHPRDDYRWIVKGGAFQVLTDEPAGEQIPRVDTDNPAQSLLLLKPTMESVHGGGLRFEKGSDDYNTILDWVRNGAPFGEQADEASRLVALEAFPTRLFLRPGEKHQVLVTGRLASGAEEDFSAEVLYEIEGAEVAEVSPSGVVEAKGPGEAAVLIRAAGRIASFQVGVIGPEPDRYPEVEPRNFIDEHIFTKLRKFNIVPSELSTDAEFLRRVCLDLTGTLPPPERVREFLSDRDPAKREKLIDILLQSPEYIDYWTYRFSDFLRVAIYALGNSSKWSQDYWEWIRESIATNKPYDQMARERIAAQGYAGPSRHFLPIAVIGPPPDTMMEEVRVFFGRRFDCARCHDHPYENWTQKPVLGAHGVLRPCCAYGYVRPRLGRLRQPDGERDCARCGWRQGVAHSASADRPGDAADALRRHGPGTWRAAQCPRRLGAVDDVAALLRRGRGQSHLEPSFGTRYCGAGRRFPQYDPPPLILNSCER